MQPNKIVPQASAVLNDFLKRAEDDSDINGSTGAVLDVALSGGKVDMDRAKGLPAKGLPKAAADRVKWDDAEKPATSESQPSIFHPLHPEFTPAHRYTDTKPISPAKMIDTNDFPAGYQHVEPPAEQNLQGEDGTILDPEMPTSKQTIIHDPMGEDNKQIKPRVQPNDFTQWSKELAPGAHVKGLPFSLNHSLIKDFLKTAGEDEPHRFTDKEHRQHDHIKDSEEDSGRSGAEADDIAWATVNKQKSARLLQDFLKTATEIDPQMSEGLASHVNMPNWAKPSRYTPGKGDTTVNVHPQNSVLSPNNEYNTVLKPRMPLEQQKLVPPAEFSDVPEESMASRFAPITGPGKNPFISKDITDPNKNKLISLNNQSKAARLLKEALNPGAVPFGGGGAGTIGKKPPMPSGRRDDDSVKPPQMSFNDVDPGFNAKPKNTEFNDYLKERYQPQADTGPKHQGPGFREQLGDSAKSVIDKAKGYFSKKPGKHDGPANSNHVQKFVDYLKNLAPKSMPGATAPQAAPPNAPEATAPAGPDYSRTMQENQNWKQPQHEEAWRGDLNNKIKSRDDEQASNYARTTKENQDWRQTAPQADWRNDLQSKIDNMGKEKAAPPTPEQAPTTGDTPTAEPASAPITEPPARKAKPKAPVKSPEVPTAPPPTVPAPQNTPMQQERSKAATPPSVPQSMQNPQRRTPPKTMPSARPSSSGVDVPPQRQAYVDQLAKQLHDPSLDDEGRNMLTERFNQLSSHLDDDGRNQTLAKGKAAAEAEAAAKGNKTKKLPPIEPGDREDVEDVAPPKKRTQAPNRAIDKAVGKSTSEPVAKAPESKKKPATTKTDDKKPLSQRDKWKAEEAEAERKFNERRQTTKANSEVQELVKLALAETNDYGHIITALSEMGYSTKNIIAAFG